MTSPRGLCCPSLRHIHVHPIEEKNFPSLLPPSTLSTLSNVTRSRKQLSCNEREKNGRSRGPLGHFSLSLSRSLCKPWKRPSTLLKESGTTNIAPSEEKPKEPLLMLGSSSSCVFIRSLSPSYIPPPAPYIPRSLIQLFLPRPGFNLGTRGPNSQRLRCSSYVIGSTGIAPSPLAIA